MHERLNVTFDALTRAGIDKLPRSLKISQTFRWVIKAVTLSELQFAHELERDVSLKVAHEYIAPRIRKILGVKSINQ